MVLLWAGLIGAWLFIVVFLVDGWTRPGYTPMRHPVSSLALGPRGWLQTANFVVCGALATAGSIGLIVMSHSLALGIGLGVFGLALVASGVFPMDPMRGYPPGADEGDPHEFSVRHRLHDAAGVVVFGTLPLCAAIAAFTLADPFWRWISGAMAIGLAAGFVAFGKAWEDDSPAAGLIQRITIILGWGWLGGLFAGAAVGG